MAPMAGKDTMLLPFVREVVRGKASTTLALMDPMLRCQAWEVAVPFGLKTRPCPTKAACQQSWAACQKASSGPCLRNQRAWIQRSGRDEAV
eukprot:11226546-Lingulodinium_polyedra.AAC.1